MNNIYMFNLFDYTKTVGVNENYLMLYSLIFMLYDIEKLDTFSVSKMPSTLEIYFQRCIDAFWLAKSKLKVLFDCCEIL